MKGYAPAHGGKQLTIREHFERGLDIEGSDPDGYFYLEDGIPYLVLPNRLYVECWARDPIRQMQGFLPSKSGKRISEARFRRIVLARQRPRIRRAAPDRWLRRLFLGINAAIAITFCVVMLR